MTEKTFWTDDQVEQVVSRRSKILGPAVWAAAQPDPRRVISFAGGLPDIPSLPADALLRATQRVLKDDRKEALEYGGTFGPEPLRREIAARSSGLENVVLSPEHIMITSGAASGIGLAGETLLDFGDTVLVESPTFPGSLRTIRSFGAHSIALGMDGDGLDIDETERTLARLRDEGVRPKFIYTIPTHQNPGGSTLSLERRERLVALAAEYGTLILEDDAYGELWVDKSPPPSLFSLSKGEHVIKISTFSKLLATGLRMGWNMGPPPLISRMAALRYDMGSSPYLGRVIAEVIRSGDLDRHVSHLREIYGRKLKRVTSAIDQYCAQYCSYERPGGGFFLWLELRPDLPCSRVAEVANEKGVIVGQGPFFFVDERTTNHLRIAFSYVDYEEIEEGIQLLGEAMAQVAGEGHSA